jgi:anti-repressor protein
MGRNKLFEWLRNNKYLMKNNIPYQNYIDNHYFEIVEYSVKTPYGDKLVVKTLITGRGQIKLLEKIRKEINN